MLKTFYRTSIAVAFSTMLPVAALAAPITITYQGGSVGDSITNFQDELDKLEAFALTEDFEGFGVGQVAAQNGGYGYDLNTRTLSTKVGTFESKGGEGGGSIAEPEKDVSRIEDTDNGGRENTSSETFTSEGIASGTHEKYLESNDVPEMAWTASDVDGGRHFDRLLFTLTDAADNNATLTVTDDNGNEKSVNGLGNNNILTFLVSFADLQSSATVTISNSGSNVSNDGWGVDSATVGAVPLPAAAWLLLGVSGALVAAKRRSARRAA